MKKYFLIITLIIVFTAINIDAQTLFNPPKLNVSADTAIRSNITKFIIGWNWGAEGKKLDEALFINSYHQMHLKTWQGNYIGDYKHDMTLFHPLQDSITGGRNCYNILNSHCLHLEPTIDVDSTTNFKPRVGDNTGGVFGFLRKSIGVIPTSGEDFNRFVLYQNSLPSGTDSMVVLADVWNGSILRWLDYDGSENTNELGDWERTNHD